MAKKQEDDCTQCHYFCRVDGAPACTDTPQKPGEPCYKFLKSLKVCHDFWRMEEILRVGASQGRGENQTTRARVAG